MLRYAYLVSGSKGAAEDLVHDAFLRMWSVVDRLDEAGLVAYARRTILNLQRSSLRRLRLRTRLDRYSVESVAEGPSTARSDVLRALSSLSAGQRACLALRFYEDLSTAQIAETLQTSEGAVKKLIRRGLDKLRPLLSEKASL